MKTIEERAQELANKSRYWTPGGAFEVRIDFFSDALTELAADLSAEKEKEVAELKTAIQELSNSKVAGDQLNAKYIKQIAELAATRARLAELEGIAEGLRRAVDVSLKAMETAYERSFTGMLRGFMGGKIDEVKAIIAYKEGKK